MIIEVYKYKTKFFSSFSNIFLIMFAALGMIFIKSTGIYIFVITMLVAILLYKGVRKKTYSVYSVYCDTHSDSIRPSFLLRLIVTVNMVMLFTHCLCSK